MPWVLSTTVGFAVVGIYFLLIKKYISTLPVSIFFFCLIGVRPYVLSCLMIQYLIVSRRICYGLPGFLQIHWKYVTQGSAHPKIHVKVHSVYKDFISRFWVVDRTGDLCATMWTPQIIVLVWPTAKLNFCQGCATKLIPVNTGYKTTGAVIKHSK